MLNIAPHAIANMQMDNEAVSFTARFSGVARSLYIPMYSVRAIYASENGQGMVFAEEAPTVEDAPKKAAPKKKSPPSLKVIK